MTRVTNSVIAKFGLALLLSMGITNASWAILLTDGVTDVGGVDTLLGTSTSLRNSRPASEAAWVDSVLSGLGVDTTALAYEYKLSNAMVLQTLEADNTKSVDTFAIDLTVFPAPAPANVVADYFIIKNTRKWALFDNLVDMGWAVVDVTTAGMYDMKIPNDWQVSHVTVISNGSVPEPSILALMGLGLLGIGFIRYRKLNA